MRHTEQAKAGRSGRLVLTSEGLAWQEFRFDGLLHSNGAIFTKQMHMTRNGERYFLVDVTKFDAR